jgi:hypothetical protein
VTQHAKGEGNASTQRAGPAHTPFERFTEFIPPDCCRAEVRDSGAGTSLSAKTESEETPEAQVGLNVSRLFRHTIRGV